MTTRDELQRLVVADLVHVLALPHGIDLLHSDEGLTERDRSEPSVKEEETAVRVDPGNDQS